jgi:hypothetical protein
MLLEHDAINIVLVILPNTEAVGSARASHKLKLHSAGLQYQSLRPLSHS